MWWHTLPTPGLRKLRLRDWEFEGNLGYKIRPCLKNKKKNDSNNGDNTQSIFVKMKVPTTLVYANILSKYNRHLS